jgi:hypothetical protein
MTNKKAEKLRRKEEKLVREAAKAFDRLQRFRQRHQRAAELADIVATARINGWSKPIAGRIARQLMTTGVGARQARVMFYEAGIRIQ